MRYSSPLFETEERKAPSRALPTAPLCGARQMLLGHLELRCVKPWNHDDPMAEVGSRRPDWWHWTAVKTDETTFEITWKSDRA